MRAFIGASLALLLILLALIWYGGLFAAFTGDLFHTLESLPDAPDEDAAETLDTLCKTWETHELLLHLSVPQGRLDAMQEKLFTLRAHARAGDELHYRAALEVARGDAEYLSRFETVTLENLI